MSISPQERFYNNSKSLSQQLSCILSQDHIKSNLSFDPSVIDKVFTFISGSDKEKFIEGFIERTHDIWDNIKLKNKHFFVENASKILGNSLNPQYLNDILKVFEDKEDGTCLIDDDDIETIYSYLFAMVKPSIRYVEKNKSTFPSINLEQVMNSWSMRPTLKI